MPIQHVIKAYKVIGVTKPEGENDSGGRWYPSDSEKLSCCEHIRSPSRVYPWSLYKHCWSTKHLKNRIIESPTAHEAEGIKMTKRTAALYINSEVPLLKEISKILLSEKGGDHE